MLGSVDEVPDSPPAARSSKALVPWWTLQPRQSVPPRQTSMTNGKSGRFIVSEELFSEARASAVTEAGAGAVSLPRCVPLLSWLTAVLCCVVAGTYSNVAALQGDEAGYDLLMGIVNDHSAVLTQGQGWRLPVSLLATVSGAQAAAALWGLVTLAPEAEALLGYSTYASVFLLSGVAGGLADALAYPYGSSSCGPAPALAGLAAALIVARLSSAGALSVAGDNTALPPAMLAQDLEESGGRVEEGRGGGGGSATESAATADEVASTTSGRDALLGLAAASCLALSLFAASLPADTFGGASAACAAFGQLSPLGLVSGAAAGALLTMGMGPAYQVSREPDIPVGSMVVPHDAKELIIVVDTRSGIQRVVVAGGFAAALLGVLSAAAAP
ncbi:hypothetical protein FOA52_010198 [Chlamydomonas sp. UWO 241]|nr:hypothetical protein FOA52_010198 [Chlamydomonas sp. UWO 241]